MNPTERQQQLAAEAREHARFYRRPTFLKNEQIALDADRKAAEHDRLADLYSRLDPDHASLVDGLRARFEGLRYEGESDFKLYDGELADSIFSDMLDALDFLAEECAARSQEQEA